MSTNPLFDYGTASAETTTQSALQFLPLWNDAKWRKLFSYAQRQPFTSGDDIIHIGDTDQTLYLILEGQLEILIPAGRWRKTLKRTQLRDAGSLIGEQAFLENAPRTATVRAVTDGLLLSITPTSFETFSIREPQLANEFALDLARVVSVKLRQANQLLSRVMK